MQVRKVTCAYEGCRLGFPPCGWNPDFHTTWAPKRQSKDKCRHVAASGGFLGGVLKW